MENISRTWGEDLPLTEKELDWYEQGDEKLYRREDKIRTWVIYKHHK